MPRCLLVDDDRDGREGYAEYLRSHGFEVDECADAEAALEAVGRQPPDILLVDLQLPGLSGWDLIREVRSSFSAAPIVAFSACVYPEDKRRAEEAGCSVFLTKPLPPTEVLAALSQLLRHKDQPGAGAGMPDA